MGSWTNRVKIPMQGKEHWFGCPLQRWSGSKVIKDVYINDSIPWRKKAIRTLEQNYSRAPNFELAMPIIRSLIEYETSSLSEFNINAIKAISRVLGLEAVFMMQSELNTERNSTELLVEIVKKVEADTYLCGGGAGGYQQDELFEEAGLGLQYQNFEHPVYDKATDQFIAGMSVIDYMMKTDDKLFL